MLKDLIEKNRSYRRFDEDFAVERKTLEELIDLARLTPSGANLQPLKYIISNEPEKNALIFPSLAWAGYLKDWNGPGEGERPSAYIIVLGDKRIRESFGFDPGIAAQSILLGATEKGLGGCMLGAIQKADLQKNLDIPAHYEILLVLAIGKPKETVIIEALGEDNDIKYWRDSEGKHHVPKRGLADIIVG